jgi:hypothetical protein
MSSFRRPFAYRPQLEALEDRLAPGGLPGLGELLGNAGQSDVRGTSALLGVMREDEHRPADAIGTPACAATGCGAHRLRHLRGTMIGVAVPTTLTPGVLSVDFTGSGRLAHLGKTTLTAHETVIFTSPMTTRIVGGSATLTAANGDQLFLAYSGTGALIEGKLQDSLSYVITGGTGRFARATGSGTAHSTTELATLAFTLDFVRSMPPVGSSQP